MNISLETLCEAQKGDYSAQSELMAVLYTPVYHFLLKRTGSGETADELCQNVFLKCYQRLNHYDESKGTVYTWVFTIARNTLIDFFKKRKDELLEHPEKLVENDQNLSAAHVAEKRINDEYLHQLLSTLDEIEADVVTLRAIDEMSYTEIAQIVEKQENTVRKIYSRALKKLRLLANDRDQQTYA